MRLSPWHNNRRRACGHLLFQPAQVKSDWSHLDASSGKTFLSLRKGFQVAQWNPGYTLQLACIPYGTAGIHRVWQRSLPKAPNYFYDALLTTRFRGPRPTIYGHQSSIAEQAHNR